MFKFGRRLDLCTFRFRNPLYCISCHIGDNVSFKFGVWTNILFVCLYIKFFIFVAMFLIGHNLHRNCGLHVIGVFNLFEHCISIEILVFDSCVGLERLHLFD